MSKFKPGQSSAVRPKPVKRLAVELTRSHFGQPSPSNSTQEEIPDPEVPGESAEEVPNAFQRIGFVTTLVFIFFRFSFAHEFIAAKFHFNTHIVTIFGAASYLCCIFSGQIFRAFRDRSTWMWSGFLAGMSVATVASYWRGGSFPLLMTYLETGFPILFVLPAVITTKSQIGKAVSIIGLACITTVLLGLLNDDFKAGRMNVDAAGSDIQDPNDYAAHIVLMIPALAFFAMRAGRPLILKLIGIGIAVLCFLQILSTGSRGGFVSLVLTALYIALIGSKKAKLGILVGIPVLALLVIPFVPSQSLARLSSLFSSSSTSPFSAEAIESQEARLALLRESWKATLDHPLTGVGPGIFMDYQAGSAQENGQRGMWHVTHNSYTQVSSECGLPAAILYVCALVSTLLLLRRCGKTQDREIAAIAIVLSVMLVGFCICMFFLSMAYNVQILVLSGLAVALDQRLRTGQKTSGPGLENYADAPVPETLPA